MPIDSLSLDVPYTRDFLIKNNPKSTYDHQKIGGHILFKRQEKYFYIYYIFIIFSVDKQMFICYNKLNICFLHNG